MPVGIAAAAEEAASDWSALGEGILILLVVGKSFLPLKRLSLSFFFLAERWSSMLHLSPSFLSECISSDISQLFFLSSDTHLRLGVGLEGVVVVAWGVAAREVCLVVPRERGDEVGRRAGGRSNEVKATKWEECRLQSLC